MGPAHTTAPDSDLSKIVRDQRKHIAHLELQLRVHECRASQLQERLLLTLDTLDSAQLAHSAELMGEQREKTKLAHTVHVYAQSLRSVEAERDDLKDAVAQLVEKVDHCNDFSLWPHTSLYQMYPADPVAGGRGPRAAACLPDTDALAYASSVISLLREERDRERRAHAQAAAESKAQIALLQAGIARREAELEARMSDPKCPACSLLQAGRLGAGTDTKTRTKRMTREDAIRVLEQSSARNYRLAVEVDTLISKLEKARGEDDASKPPSHSPRPRGPGNVAAGNVASATPDAEHERARSTGAHNSETHCRPAQPRGELAEPIQALDRQIDALADDLGALRSERRHLAASCVRSSTPVASDARSHGDFGHILLIERECVRLAGVEAALREELVAASAREQALFAELRSLRARLEPADPSQGAQGNVLSDEQSMELATPLQPTAPLAGADPPLIHLSPPTSTAPDSPVLPADFALETAELAEGQDRLEAAAAELRGKEHELRVLRDELDSLHRSIVDQEHHPAMPS